MLLYVSVDICFIVLVWILPFLVLYVEILFGFCEKLKEKNRCWF